MKRYFAIFLPVVLAMGILLLPSFDGSNSFGQTISNSTQNNQTTPNNQTMQFNQTNPSAAEATTTAGQPQQANQTQQQQQNNQSKLQDPKMIENLLNYTNTAIIALNNDNETLAQQNLVQIQNALVDASGKQVIVIPAPAIQSGDDDDSD
jgi:hypothetical protein